jgi:diguanylate cyclase (GGDEF)-like protein
VAASLLAGLLGLGLATGGDHIPPGWLFSALVATVVGAIPPVAWMIGVLVRERRAPGLALPAAAARAEPARPAGDRPTGLGIDPLTGLSDRPAFEVGLAEALVGAHQGGGGLCVGLVAFHAADYVERHGEKARDRALREVAAALISGVRRGDVVGRYDAERFALALSRTGVASAERLATRLLSALPPGISASVGLAVWSPAEDATRLLARAERATREAARAGRDQVVVAPSPVR